MTRTLFCTFIVAGAQVLARLCAVGVIDVLGRKRMIVLGHGIAECAALALAKGTTETSLLLTAMTCAFFQDMGSLAITLYTSKVYPVHIRRKGTAPAMGWGRLGGMTWPLIAGVLISAGNLMLVWRVIAGATLLARGLTLVPAYETRGNLELVSSGAD